jgi:hypothetical protein
MTNIYSSDLRGQQFSLTLMHTVRSEEGNVDFERVLGSQGTFVANVYDQVEIERARERGTKEKRETHGKQPVFNSIDAYKKTKISYNNGGTWHSLKAPELDYKGEKISCSGEC